MSIYNVKITSDAVHGKNNFGSKEKILILSEDKLNELVNNFNMRFGKYHNIGGLLIWARNGLTYTISALKKKEK